MARAHLRCVVRHLRQLVGAPDADLATDGEVLQRFAACREEAAFDLLVRRHGGMVLGVCRSVLRHAQDAEDVFQATFLVLAKKAATLRRQDSVAGWLYRVAYRLAQKRRARAAAVRHRESQAPGRSGADAADDLTWRELRQVLHEELNRLPDKLRQPVVLCYLEGKTRDEAARQLGWALGTLKGRLERARDLLRRRLGRRGLAPGAALLASLLAHDLAAAVPAGLAGATTGAALAVVHGSGSLAPSVAGLVEEGLRGLGAAPAKIAAGVALALALCAAAGAFLVRPAAGERSGPRGGPTAAERPAPRAARPATPKPAPTSDAPVEKLTVTGQVLAADGKPAARVPVAVLVRESGPLRTYHRETFPRILGQGKTDGAGRFRFVVSLPATSPVEETFVLAGGPGHGLGEQKIDAAKRSPEVTLRLHPERILRGRLVDINGQPARGVQVRVRRLVGLITAREWVQVDFRDPPDGLAAWPAPATTDGRGRFTVRGLPPKCEATLLVRDERFARQSFRVEAAAAEATLTLAPAYVLEGTVRYADTGKPVSGARIDVASSKHQFGSRMEMMDVRTDARGRYRFSAPAGTYFFLMVHPPAGTPYHLQRKELTRERAEVGKKGVDFALPRGILARGRVVEAGSGRPVAGAMVDFHPNRDDNPYFRDDIFPFLLNLKPLFMTNARGEFAVPMLPGPGHLVVTGPTNDYLHVEIGTKQLDGRQVNPNWRNYYDAIVPLNLKPQAGPHELTIEVRRGVTVRGKVVGPDGKPIARGLMVCRSQLKFGPNLNPVYPLDIKDGRFELPGCDPARALPVFFFDPKNRLGAVAELSGKEAGKPLTITLQPCGRATARLVDRDGKPVAGVSVNTEVVVTPGISFAGSLRSKELVADVALMESLDREGQDPAKLRSDARGRITFPNLIPGATYWLTGHRRNVTIYSLNKEFRVRTGQTLDLGDLVVPPEN